MDKDFWNKDRHAPKRMLIAELEPSKGMVALADKHSSALSKAQAE